MIKIGRILAAGLLAYSSAISFAQEAPKYPKIYSVEGGSFWGDFETLEEAIEFSESQVTSLRFDHEETTIEGEKYLQYYGYSYHQEYGFYDPNWTGGAVGWWATPELAISNTESQYNCSNSPIAYENITLTSEFKHLGIHDTYGYTATYTESTYGYDDEKNQYDCSNRLSSQSKDALIIVNMYQHHDIHISLPDTESSNTSVEDCDSCRNKLDKRLDHDSSFRGNPINLATGNKQQVELDYDGKYLKFERYYNSIKNQHLNSNLGNGWSHSYSDRLILKEGDGTYLSTIDKLYTTAGQYDYFSGEDSTRFADRKLSENESATEYYYSLSHEDRIYNSNGFLSKIIHRDGQETTISRNADNTIDEITDPFGRKLIFSYIDIDGENYVSSILLPDGKTISYSYDYIENLEYITYQDNSVRQYHYEDTNYAALLTGITDERGIRYATWTYDAEGLAIESRHEDPSDGYFDTLSITSRSNNGDGTKTVTVANSKGAQNTVTFKRQSGVWKIISETLHDGGIISANFDASSGYSQTANSRTDANGNTANHQTDPTTGNSISIGRGNAQSPDYQEDHYSWGEYDTSVGGYIYQIDEVLRNNHKINYTYDERLKTSVKITDLTNYNDPYATNGLIREWKYSYNSLGQITLIEGPRVGVNDNVSYTYDSMGNIATISKGDCDSGTNCLITTYNNYDANGRPLSITEPNGINIIITYTPRGWVKTVEYNYSTTESALTTYQYDAVGNIDKIILPTNAYLDYDYNGANYLTSIINSLGERINFIVDSEGKVTRQTTKDSNSNVVTQQQWVYTSTNRLLMHISGAGFETEFLYDNIGNPTNIFNDIGQETRFTYDSLNRIATKVDAKNGTISKTYTANNQVATITDQKGNTTTYTYNGFGDLIKLDSPDTGTERYWVDESGNTTQSTRNDGVITNYTYDSLNRVTSKKFPSNPNEDVDYEYDTAINGIGKIGNIYYEHGSINYEYNSQGLLDSSISVINGITYETAYEYNIVGNLTRIEYPSGMIVDYELDELNRITDVLVNNANQIANIQYIPYTNTIRFMEYENGVIYDALFNLDANPIAIAHETETGTVLLDEEYNYELTNRISSITNYNDPSKSQSFTYSPVGELLTATGGYGSLSYTYDATGNRLSLNDNGSIYTYDVEAEDNLLHDVYGPTSGRSFTYDMNGNMTQDLRHDGTLVELSYNANNRLAEVTIGADDYAYGYNPFGQRVLEDGKVNTYGQNGELLSVYDGVSYKEYVYLNGIKVAVAENGVINYIHNNYLGVPAVITDSSGGVVWEGDYKPFGEMYDVNGTLSNNIRFPGQYKNEESGYSYNYYRDYDPTIGRYLQSDPIGLNGGINTYGYVGGNPVSYTDQYGLDREVIFTWAKASVGRTDWSTSSQHYGVYYMTPIERVYRELTQTYGSGAPKCNLFVYDTLKHSGHTTPMFNGRPAVAKEWADEELTLTGYEIIDIKDIKAGDIISDGKHMGIYNGNNQTISAGSADINISKFGFNGRSKKVVARRCVNCEIK